MHVLGVAKRPGSWSILENRLGLGLYLVIWPLSMVLWTKLALSFVCVEVVSYVKIFLECAQYILPMYTWFIHDFSSTLTHDTWSMCYLTWISLKNNLISTLIYMLNIRIYYNLLFGKDYAATELWYEQLNGCTIFFNIVQTVHFWLCVLTWFLISIKFPTKSVLIQSISEILLSQHF